MGNDIVMQQRIAMIENGAKIFELLAEMQISSCGMYLGYDDTNGCWVLRDYVGRPEFSGGSPLSVLSEAKKNNWKKVKEKP